MKKGIVILLVALALIVLISPAIVGRLAERSVDDNLNWAAEEARDVVVTSERFDRGWFSSEGQHRIELLEGRSRDALMLMMGNTDTDELPALIINTRMDHGLIPVTSMTREKGSLAPGLGSAISTLRLEMPDGESVELPGMIYSNVGLTGDLTSNYVTDSGTFSEAGTTATWGEVDVTVAAAASGSAVGFEGTVEAFDLSSESTFLEFHDLSFSGTQRPSGHGFYVGDASYKLKSVAYGDRVGPLGFGPFVMDTTANVEGDALVASATASIAGVPVPNIGELSVDMEISIAGVDPAALGKLIRAAEAAESGNADPTSTMGFVENEAKQLLSKGLQLSFDKLDVTFPQGTLETDLSLLVKERDGTGFEWTSLLLATEGKANVRVPEALMDFIMQMNPQASAIVGMGYLKKNGDVYELQAAYKKGLLTINGAPMPIPLPGS